MAIEFDPTALLSRLGFESMLHDPSLIGGRKQNFARLKTRYVHAYSKVHRAHYEAVADLATKLDSLRPKAQALTRMNGILELDPPLAATATIAANLKRERGRFNASAAPDKGHQGCQGQARTEQAGAGLPHP